MLVVSRRADEAIQIKLADGVDGSLTLAALFAKGPIEITLLGGNGRRVKMGIAAPPNSASCASTRARRPPSAPIKASADLTQHNDSRGRRGRARPCPRPREGLISPTARQHPVAGLAL